jgi:hypothetical protein
MLSWQCINPSSASETELFGMRRAGVRDRSAWYTVASFAVFGFLGGRPHCLLTSIHNICVFMYWMCVYLALHEANEHSYNKTCHSSLQTHRHLVLLLVKESV